MAIVVRNIVEIEHYRGDHAIPGIRFRPAREALGVSAWGMNVLELDAHCEGYPQHDHVHDGQEELYVVLEGSAVLVAEGTERTVRKGDLVRVPADVTRKFVTREEAVTLLAIGGTPGRPYSPDPRMSST